MSLSRMTRLFSRPHLRVIAIVGLIVPRWLRIDWRQEWETELRHREMLLAEWDRLDWRHKLDLFRRSTSAFWDAVWLQRRRLETEMWQDLRYGARLLWISPGFTAVAVITLALGIGANTAIFTLLDKVMIRTLPVEAPDRLVTFVSNADAEPAIVSHPLYTDLRGRTDVWSGVAAYLQRPFSISDGTRNERIIGQFTSGNYFDVLGVRPALGRFFLPEEDRTPGSSPVAVISHGLWVRRFGGDPAVIGKKISVNGRAYTVIGIAPAEFTGVTRGTTSDAYVPATMLGDVMPNGGRMLANRNSGWLTLIARLGAGVSREQAQAALSLMMNEPDQTPPKANDKGRSKGGLFLMDGSRGHTNRVSDLALPLKLMMGVVGFVLLIACANVANLLLARASTRSREIGVRLAVGASRLRIVRQLMTESTLLAAAGGIGGLLIARWCLNLLLGFGQQTSFVPRTLEGSLDLRTLTFTFGLSLLTAVVFSLVPALHASSPDYVTALKGASPGLIGRARRFGLRNTLVVTQVALSMVVLICAGLCVKSLRTLQAVDPGLEPAKVLTAAFDLGLNGYTEPRARQFVADLSTKAAALPGVEAVSFARIVAFSGFFWVAGAQPEGYEPQQRERLAFDFNTVSPDYFRTIGTTIISGREFTAQDTADAPLVAVVNEATARRYWPGQDAVGKRMRRGDSVLEIVGVVRNSREKGLTEAPRPAIYLPLFQSSGPDLNLTLHVRAATDVRSLMTAVRREVNSLDPTLPLYNVRTLEEQKDGMLFTERLAATLLTLFGALALVVATIGIYGVLSYGVTERTREIGIRLAHGARPRDLVRLVVGEGMAPTLIGVAIGLGGAFALTRVMQRLLFGVSPTDPLTFGLTPFLLVVVALAACWIPARRATRLDPLIALRHE
jgi:predicted permease